ncbi:MAG: tripartite tricarboxylate transporter substrate binding protein [Betaproteobacteria bacterium]|jgi:tripartite-type tricarboxylate transporter receptor subunit TctC|nr:MAG: tripartite tricarboxylate transporter substrate binding protein [Betaproteobacteria bacterium]TMH83207.1 MAG: tripartite tricarboxylate transporter substrate binding protein [Betaproteobacteria bacterium]
MRSHSIRVGTTILLASATLPAAFAQHYPTKPVRMVVPFAAGGAVDTVARALGQKLVESWKQPMLVDNRPGAGGNIAADHVAKAPGDGYTLLITTHGFAISPGLYRKLPFDAARDFAPVTQLTSSFVVLVTNPQIPAASVKELIALAKSRPGAINYGSTGIGAPPHLLGELLKSMTGTDMLHVPYKGDAPLNQALLAGEVQLAFMPLAGVLSHIRSGRLRALGVSGTARSATLPEVPTLTEAGVPFEFTGWLGVFAPAGSPRDIVIRIQRDIAQAILAQDMRERWSAWGYEPVGSTPEQFAEKYKLDLATYAKVIRDAKIPLQD